MKKKKTYKCKCKNKSSSNNKTDNKKSSTKNDSLEDEFKKLDIELATIEKIGSSLLLIGYLYFIIGSDIDIKDTLDINNTGLRATSITLQGGELILAGYVLLFIVAYERLTEKIEQNILEGKNNILSPNQKLSIAYFVSIWINIIRVEALAELDYIDRNSETFV